MNLPFGTEQFWAVFVAYNAAIWPAQLVGYGLGLGAVLALRLRHPHRERTVLAILAVLWAWNGLAYHLTYFAEINPAAPGFAAIFVLQAVLFAHRAVFVHDLRIEVSTSWRSVVGLCLIVYALLIYEMLGAFAGHGLMKGPLFGVAPCPTTIFTIGLLMMASGRSVRWLSVIPITWALIGTSAAVLLNVPEDFGLGIAGAALLLAIAMDWFDNARVAEVAAEKHRRENCDVPEEPRHVAILGASGSVGRRIVDRLLAYGTDVVCQTRNAEKLADLPGYAEVWAFDPHDTDELAAFVKGADAVIFALGTDTTGTTTLFSDVTRALIPAMQTHGVRRLIAITGVGAGETRGHGGFLYDRVIFPLFTRKRYQDKERQEELIAESGLDWTIVRPAPFRESPGPGPLKVITEIGPETRLTRITCDEVADFVVTALDGDQYLHQRPFIGHE